MAGFCFGFAALRLAVPPEKIERADEIFSAPPPRQRWGAGCPWGQGQAISERSARRIFHAANQILRAGYSEK
jgi:hypothetical protein